MDSNSDRLPNYWLWHMNENGTAFEVWTVINLHPGNEQVGMLWYISII